MAKMNRGIFYTIGFFLIILVLISFAFLISKGDQKTKEILTEISAFTRANELVLSIQEGLKDIFKLKSGITIGNDFSMSESMPNSKANDFKESINNYKKFIEGNNLSVTLNVDELNKNLPLKIVPHNITYNHSDYGENKVKINAQTNNFDKYKIIVSTVLNLDASSCGGSGGNPSVGIEVEAIGSTGSCTISGYSIITIKEKGPGLNLIATFVLNGYNLTINAIRQVNAKTKIGLNDLGETHIIFPENIIILNMSDFNIARATTVEIL